MPAVGDQHRVNPTTTYAAITANPFETAEKRMSEYTAQEIATLQSRLDKQLGPEYISSRPGAGGQRVHYLAAEKCINLANEVFGFNGWSSSIQNIQIDFIDENANSGRISLGLSVIVRVTLKDGTYHEDIGYGHIENCKGKAAAFDKAKKEGTTDALKRALRTFGKVLGNCIYDKDYLAKVTKMKIAPSKFDSDGLHRHADYAPVKKEPQLPVPAPGPGPEKAKPDPEGLPPRLPDLSADVSDDTFPMDLEGEFGSDLFDEADFGESRAAHPDEVSLDPEPPAQPNPPQNQTATAPNEARRNVGPRPNELVTPSKPAQAAPGPTPVARPGAAPSNGERAPRSNLPPVSANNQPPANSRTPTASRPPQPQPRPLPAQKPASASDLPPPLPGDQPKVRPDTLNTRENNSPNKSQNAIDGEIPEEQRPEDPTGGFYSARAADTLRNNPYGAAKVAPTFDPRFDSPSIRKTAGFNHNHSAPVSRKTYTIVPPKFTQDGSAQPLASQSDETATTDPLDKIRRGGTTPVSGNFASPTGVRGSPMTTTSYRPPTRRIMTRSNAGSPAPPSNTNTGTNMQPPPPQNANGKRPPLADMTNARPNAASTEAGGGSDAAKRVKADGNTAGNPALQQQQGTGPAR